MAYTKLFQKILASSIWTEDMATRLVWITFLAMKDHNHIVQGSVAGIANIARVSVAECRKAIEKFESPDADDSSGVREGRRIEKLEHGGWLVINGAAYRDSKDEDERRAWMANYMREYRKRKQNVNNRKHLLTPVDTSDQIRSEKEISGVLDLQGVKQTKERELFHLTPSAPKRKERPQSLDEVKAYLIGQLKLTEEDACWLWEHWHGNGFTLNGKTAIKNWKMVASSWERMKGKKNPYPSRQPIQ